MTEIYLNLNNFTDFEALLSLFPASKEYEFTAKKVFRSKKRVICCGQECVHDGHDFIRKKRFGKARVGKQLCKVCQKQYHEDKIFWKKLLGQWQETITSLILTLRDSHLAWETVQKVMNFIIPFGKTKALSLFNYAVEQFEYPQDNFLIVNYDEQHPKRGRMQKFRLTLLNYKTKVPIAEGLFDNKNDETIEAFLRKYLDADKEIVIITDCDRRYPAIFKKIFGKKVIHQKCLLHLNKLVVKDFGRGLSLQNIHNLYLILNIFYNRRKEIKFIARLLKKLEKKTFANASQKKEWIKEHKNKFYDHVKKLENERRREGKNLSQRSLLQAKKVFAALWQQKNFFPKAAKKRLDMIKDNWDSLTAFYKVEGCPATNNAVENYYSTSLKTHRKNQLRTDKGIINHMKLSALKRVYNFSQPKRTLLDIYGLITLIIS
ncbi:MAG: transposase [Patescibacteria group bacterium]